jgi:hypothetical protein
VRAATANGELHPLHGCLSEAAAEEPRSSEACCLLAWKAGWGDVSSGCVARSSVRGSRDTACDSGASSRSEMSSENRSCEFSVAMQSLESGDGVGAEEAAACSTVCTFGAQMSRACQVCTFQLAGYTTPASVKMHWRHGMLAKEGGRRGGTRARSETRVAAGFSCGTWLMLWESEIRIENVLRET